eukprot:m.185387 g.185387  ORF g.185387 m.185387 type:complete len:197 (-) comp25562_c0_seq8:509-1099(-)
MPREVDVDDFMEKGQKSDLNTWKVTCPQTLYAAIPFGQIAQDHTNSATVYFHLVYQWLFLLLIIVIQAALIVFLNDIADSHEGEGCSGNSASLRLIALLVYTAQIWTDIAESFQVTLYLMAAKHETSALPRFKLNDDGKLCISLPVWYKILTGTFSVIPKFGLGVALWYFGCRYLACLLFTRGKNNPWNLKTSTYR